MNEAQNTEPVVVVGGGVAGLATALALLREGRPSTVLERSENRDGEGYGLLLMRNGQTALDRLGVLAAVTAAGTFVTARHDRLADGRDLGRTALTPHLVVPRLAVVRAMLDALPPDVVRVGAAVTAVDPGSNATPAIVEFADGERMEAGVVVGADGARSVLRSQVAPTTVPGSALGEVLGQVSLPDVHARLAGAINKWVDPRGGLAVGITPGGGDEVYVYVQVDPARHEPPPEPDALARWLDTLFGDWPEPVSEVLAALDTTTVAYKVSTDIDPLSSYVTGRLALVGDAAHPMLTLSTQGASTALEDGCALATALVSNTGAAEALAAYDGTRVPVGQDRTRAGRLRLMAFRGGTPAFDDADIDHGRLRERAYNHRWAMQPHDVIPLTAADPDFDAPPVVREAIAEYVARGALSYGPPEGLPSFRAACAAVLSERRGVETSADDVIAADSAASAMYLQARWLLKPGDEAIVFDPIDYLFVGSVEAAGATVVRCPLDTATGRFDPDQLASLVTPRTRMIGVCNPHNPLGHVLELEELEQIAELVLRNDLYVMNDEVWADVIHAPHEHRSIASLDAQIAARTVTIGGFSKSFGLAGLRIGYLACPDRAVRDGLFAASSAASTAWGAATLSQVAAEVAYTAAWPWFAAFRNHLTQMRDLGVRRLNAIEGISCRAPEGTYLLFPDIRGLGVDAETLAEHVLKVGRVAVVPGSSRWFGDRAQGHVRLAFPTSEAVLSEALDRFETAVAAL